MGDSAQTTNGQWRILALARGEIPVAIINHLKKYGPKSAQIIHIGGRKADINLSSLLRMSNKKARNGHIMEGDEFSGAASDLISSELLDEAMMIAVDNLQRGSGEFKYKFHHINSFNDCQHYYHIAVDVLANILLRDRINLVLFFNIPHLFYDTLMYQVAKARGIKILILAHSLFPNLYFSLRAIEDNGKLPPLPNDYSVEPLTIDSAVTLSWYYMKNIRQERGELGHLSIRGIVHLLAHLLTNTPSKILHPLYIVRLVKRMQRISSSLPKWRDPFASFFHVKHLTYFETLLEFEDREIDLARKFVYFPLQLQPEMTTASLGGCFSDQLLAIEQLAQIIPDDCSIYVKENPKQTGQMRGPLFFNRLTRIRNLQILPSYANTHELTDRAEFVATITGTVGWEAIRKGKKVLVFGMPWYRNLPGVISYHKNLKFEEICKITYHHATLEQQAGWLVSRLHSGVIGRSPYRETKEFNMNSNTHLVANTIVELIEGRIETTFTQ